MTRVQLLWLTITGILLVIAGAYFLIGKRQVSKSETKRENSIFLYVRGGDVSYKGKKDPSFLKATSSPIIISNNSYVHTGLGQATIVFPDNSSIDMDRYTQIEIVYEKDKTSLYQTLGTTYHRVHALLSGKSYEVVTPGAVAAIRGTKFAVKYDKKTKMTKVAVTENAVSVSRTEASGSSTQPVTVEENKMAKIDEYASKDTHITIGDISSDPDMKIWVDTNKVRDTEIDSFGKDEFRSRMENMLLNETGKSDTVPAKPSDLEEKNAAAQKPLESDMTKKASDTTVQEKPASETLPEQDQAPVVINKLDEEVFFTQFDNLFSDYFYLDETDKPCSFAVSSGDRVKKITSFASASGWPFSSDTLLSFAQAIDSYCKNKTPDAKTRLEQRFDNEYPFRDGQ